MIKGKNKFLTILLCSFFSCVVLFGITLLSPNMTKVSANSELNTDFYVTGAQIRTDDTVAGIRYNIVVGEGLYNSLIQANGQDAKIDFGAYIAPAEDITNIEDLNASFPEVLTILSKGNINSDIPENIEFKDGYAEYQVAVMYDIQRMLEAIKNNDKLNSEDDAALLRQAFKMDLTARPFYKVNGEVKGYGDTADRSMRAIMDAAVIDGHVTDSQLIDQYLGNITEADETVYYDVTSGQLVGLTAEPNVTYAWKGKPVTLSASQDVLTLNGVGEVESGTDAYLSVFDENCNVKRVPVKCVTVIDSAEEFEEIFSSTETLSGYYMLGKNIDASNVSLSGAIRSQSVFNGTFDGCGFTISDLNISASGMPENWTLDDTRGSLFGKLQYPAVIKNVGFKNVKASYAAVIGSRTISKGEECAPILSNLYIDVNASSVNFAGVISSIQQNNALPAISNVIVNAPLESYPDDGTRAGSFFGCEWFLQYLPTLEQSPFANNYVISPFKLTNYYGYTEYQGAKFDNVDGITRYNTLTEMFKADNDLSSFDDALWIVSNGIASWKTFGGDINDYTARKYSIADGVLDLSDLGVQQSEITAIEIEGTKFDVENGVLPEMKLVNSKDAKDYGLHHDEEELTLTVGGISLVLTKDANDKDFNAITIKVYTENDAYILNNVNVYSKIIKNATDLNALFGAQGALTGYYILGDNVDATQANTLGVRNVGDGCEFAGIFDGMGNSIYNIKLSSNGGVGSLFGYITAHAAIRNAAFVNVVANNCAVISNTTSYYSYGESNGYPSGKVNNLYIEVSPETTNFYGVIAQMATNNGDWGTYVENVVVRYDGEIADDATVKGAFFGHKNCATIKRLSNNYLISSENIITQNGQELFATTGIVKYANIAAMKADTSKDLSSFSVDYWTKDDGSLVWNTAPIIAYPVIDNNERSFSAEDGTLDLTGLGITKTDIVKVEINGKEYAVVNGVMPSMTIENKSTAGDLKYHWDNYKLTVTVDGTDSFDCLAESGEFSGISFKLYTSSNVYTLNNVRIYSKVINTPQEFAKLFSSQEALSGYYVLGDHIDASDITLTGALRNRKLFTGIFDGRGYTVKNLNVSSTGSMGSLIGMLYSNSVFKNVALLDVTANGSAIIADNAQYGNETGGWGKPMISNVYVKVSETTTDFYGIVGGGPNYHQGHAKINNVIVEYDGLITGDDTTTAKGAFVGYFNSHLTAEALEAIGCYLISNECITTLNGQEAYNDTDIVRYESAEAMKNANNNYSTFNYCWTVVSGEIPVWAKLPKA